MLNVYVFFNVLQLNELKVVFCLNPLFSKLFLTETTNRCLKHSSADKLKEMSLYHYDDGRL